MLWLLILVVIGCVWGKKVATFCIPFLFWFSDPCGAVWCFKHEFFMILCVTNIKL